MGWLRGLAVNEIVRCTTRLGVGLWWGFSGGLVPCGGVRRPFSRVCDTPRDCCVSNVSLRFPHARVAWVAGFV